MVKTLLELDHIFTQYIKYLFPQNSAVVEAFFSLLSFQGMYILVWIVLLIFVIFSKKNKKMRKKFVLAFFAALGTTSFIVSILLKIFIHRIRPWIIEGILTTKCPSDFSFPSGHAAGAFAGASILAFFDRKHAVAYYGIAAMISISRIYFSCHYLSDVLFGALIGYLIGKVTISILANRKLL